MLGLVEKLTYGRPQIRSLAIVKTMLDLLTKYRHSDFERKVLLNATLESFCVTRISYGYCLDS